MTVWIVLAVVVVLLACLLFGPIDARVRLGWPLELDLRVTWFSIPIPLKARSNKPKASRGKRKGPSIRKLQALFRLRTGRAIMAVIRVPGLTSLVMELARKAFQAIELVKADFLVAAGVGKAGKHLWLAAALSGIRPRVVAGQGRINIEVSPDFDGRRFELDGEMILRTRPWPWLVLCVRALCSRTLWRAWRTWKREND